jgi:hypothetical protein
MRLVNALVLISSELLRIADSKPATASHIIEGVWGPLLHTRHTLRGVSKLNWVLAWKELNLLDGSLRFAFHFRTSRSKME